MKIEFLREAEFEFLDAISYYEGERQSLQAPQRKSQFPIGVVFFKFAIRNSQSEILDTDF